MFWLVDSYLNTFFANNLFIFTPINMMHIILELIKCGEDHRFKSFSTR